MCGEKKGKSGRRNRIKGSPPHVRGKAFLRQCRNGFVGITPACAGKSISLAVGAIRLGDHPRMCGEKTKKIP